MLLSLLFIVYFLSLLTGTLTIAITVVVIVVVIAVIVIIICGASAVLHAAGCSSSPTCVFSSSFEGAVQ